MNRDKNPDRLLVAVDCIIFGYAERQLQTLLIERSAAPLAGELSLMGGLVRREESIDDAATRVLHKLTGLKEVYLEQHQTYGEVGRDGRERTISVSYYALTRHAEASKRLQHSYRATWHPVSELPGLFLDHNHMIGAALDRLRYRATYEPVAFNLLPAKFTLIDLQTLYENLFGRDIDAGNFRRRLRRMDYLKRLDEKDRRFSKKGAYYYRFDRRRYERAVAAGHSFLLKP
jgi:hypothetical protein